LYELLPILRGWQWIHREIDGVLGIGEEKEIDRVEAPGMFCAAGCLLEGSRDAKYVRLHVEFDGPERAYPIDFSAYGLKAFNLSMPISFGAYFTLYDDTSKQYAAVITPSKPMPFARRFTAKFIAPTAPTEEAEALPITYHIAYEAVKIVDVEELKASLQEVLGARPVRRLAAGVLA